MGATQEEREKNQWKRFPCYNESARELSLKKKKSMEGVRLAQPVETTTLDLRVRAPCWGWSLLKKNKK